MIQQFGQKFVWDVKKEEINKRKHGVDFETAAAVFLDDNRIEFLDKLHSLDEERYVTIGISLSLITVIYTVRDDTIRIISARIST